MTTKTNKNSQILEFIKKDLKDCENMLIESYVFDDEDLNLQQAENGEDVPPTEEEQPQQNNDAKSMDRVAKIREVALEGLQEYANDINNIFYDFYKKIWQSCDKVMTDKSNTKQQEAMSQQPQQQVQQNPMR